MTFLFCIILVSISSIEAVTFTNQWAAKITGGSSEAKRIAEQHGFEYLGPILPDVYHLRHRRVSKRSSSRNAFHHSNLAKHYRVAWLDQQIVKKRVKRDLKFNDPQWSKMWYLNRPNGLHMNVIGAWELGYTGKNSVVTILDDGIEKDHPDLMKNYDPKASFDINAQDADPAPRYDITNENKHGTRCAGEVAAQGNNGICNVGIAYDARIGGVRMLDGDVTDSVEAKALGLNPDYIQIYSASWGPDDDGATVDGPARLARHAFLNGILTGRGGLGSIFLWASGNGGHAHDSCSCDGYTNSPYTLSISSTTENGNVPWYSEACSSTLATTYSSGAGGERQISTTDLRHTCTDMHTGTSASAPLAAAICALTLEANPRLSWRDLQHIVVRTARKANLKAEDWVQNGVGRLVSHHYGFGLMDAKAMVVMASNWSRVPDQKRCVIRVTGASRVVPSHGSVTISVHSDGCKESDNFVRYVEHVQSNITLGANLRGEVEMFLTSPSGTKSILLPKRQNDRSGYGFTNWEFMTTHNWGEQSIGLWSLQVQCGACIGALKNWELILLGTSSHPYAAPIPKTSTPVGTTRLPTGTANGSLPKVHNIRRPYLNSEPTNPPSTTQSAIISARNCAGEQEGSSCLVCLTGYYLLNQLCHESCPAGYYGVQLEDSAVCRDCERGCEVCRGPGPAQCDKCKDNFKHENFQCIEKLILGFIDPNLMHLYILCGIAVIGSVLSLMVVCLLIRARDAGIWCFQKNRGYTLVVEGDKAAQVTVKVQSARDRDSDEDDADDESNDKEDDGDASSIDNQENP